LQAEKKQFSKIEKLLILQLFFSEEKAEVNYRTNRSKSSIGRISLPAFSD
jgi:hypothetical protein